MLLAFMAISFITACTTAQATQAPTPLIIEVTRVIEITSTFEATLPAASTATPEETPTVVNVTPTTEVIPVEVGAFVYKCVDVMKFSQDVASRAHEPFIEEAIPVLAEWIAKSGANCVAVSTSITAPTSHDVDYLTQQWVNAAAANNLMIYWRQKTSEYEGFNGAQRVMDPQWHIDATVAYIKSHPEFFRSGDVYSIPEPENAGVRNLNGCSECLFSSIPEFNEWLVNWTKSVQQAFAEIGLGGQVGVGYFGFSGYTAWGDRNTDDYWQQGALIRPGFVGPSGSVLDVTGEVTVDHYWNDGNRPAEEMRKYRSKIPDEYAINIGEWGAIHGEDAVFVKEMLLAVKHEGVFLFNYWSIAGEPPRPDEEYGKEFLLEWENGQLVPNEKFFAVQEVYSQ
jgi:hypothetical protein